MSKFAKKAVNVRTEPVSLKVRIAEQKDVNAIVAFEEDVFEEPENRLQAGLLSEWMKKCPECFFILYEESKVYGHAGCLPLRPNVLERLKRDNFPFNDSLVSEFLISLDEAKQRMGTSGNVLFPLVTAISPSTGTVEYGEYSVPLFLAVMAKFYELRMCAAVGRSHDVGLEAVWKNAGGEEVCDPKKTLDGQTRTWAFDRKTAERKTASGLSVIYYTLWGTPLSSGICGFSRREIEILRVLAYENEHIKDKELANRFYVSVETIKSHFQSMFNKCQDSKLFHGIRPDRTQLAIYCMRHPQEILLPPSESDR